MGRRLALRAMEEREREQAQRNTCEGCAPLMRLVNDGCHGNVAISIHGTERNKSAQSNTRAGRYEQGLLLLEYTRHVLLRFRVRRGAGSRQCFLVRKDVEGPRYEAEGRREKEQRNVHHIHGFWLTLVSAAHFCV